MEVLGYEPHWLGIALSLALAAIVVLYAGSLCLRHREVVAYYRSPSPRLGAIKLGLTVLMFGMLVIMGICAGYESRFAGILGIGFVVCGVIVGRIDRAERKV